MRVPNHPLALKAALTGLVELNRVTMSALASQGHYVPSVYEAGTTFDDATMHARARELWLKTRGREGIKYAPEPPGREWWETWIDSLGEAKNPKAGTDCEDLACYQTGYYQAIHGIPAIADVVRTGRRTYHAVVRWPDGSIEDPSLVLGMPDPRDFRARRRARGQ